MKMKKTVALLSLMISPISTVFAAGDRQVFTETWPGVYAVDDNPGAVTACQHASLQACTNARGDCKIAGIDEEVCEYASCDSIDISNDYTQVANSYCTATVQISVVPTPAAVWINSDIPAKSASKNLTSAKQCRSAQETIAKIEPKFAEGIGSLQAVCNNNVLTLTYRAENVSEKVGGQMTSVLAFSGMYGNKSDCQNAKALLLNVGGPELSFGAAVDSSNDCESNFGNLFSKKYRFSFNTLVRM
jgi:hypothetical protein